MDLTMMRSAHRMVLAVACVGMLAACSPFADDIDAVKDAQTDGQRNEDFIQRLAGAEGKIVWSARRWEQYPKNSNIIFVEAAVDKTTHDGSQHKIVVQFVYNRVGGQAELFDILVDGRSQGILGGELQMLLLRLE